MLPNTHNPSYSQPSLKAAPSSSLPCVNPKSPTHPPAPPHTLHNFANQPVLLNLIQLSSPKSVMLQSHPAVGSVPVARMGTPERPQAQP